jgi:MoaA/NifB/PqqE/SkfB family radical SAM enzyme
MPTPIPLEAIVSVTNRCDARCEMCNIWQLDRQELLGPEDYRRALPNSLQNVNLTGGEALLRPDIVEVAHAIYEASGCARIIIATNGFRTERTLATLGQIRAHVPEVGVAVSIDGNAATHDRMRGVPKAYERAIETLKSLHAIGIRDVRIGFTATPENVAELVQVYELAQSLGVEFAATIAQNSKVYYSTDVNRSIPPTMVERHFGALIDKRLASPSPKNWLRAYFDDGVIHFAKTGERKTQCDAASGFFYLAPSGDVYPCLTVPTALGNIREQSFDEIWNSERARNIREQVSSCRKCWMVCTSRTQIKRQPFAVASWIAREQATAVAARAMRAIGLLASEPR